MRIKKFDEINELYDQVEKNWENDANYYTFTCEVTVKAKSMEEAEDKMEFIANSNDDVELGMYNLNYASENGETYNGSDLIAKKKIDSESTTNSISQLEKKKVK